MIELFQQARLDLCLTERSQQYAGADQRAGFVNVHVLQSVSYTHLDVYKRQDQLLRHADQAMYQAKEAGKNRFHRFEAEP